MSNFALARGESCTLPSKTASPSQQTSLVSASQLRHARPVRSDLQKRPSTQAVFDIRCRTSSMLTLAMIPLPSHAAAAAAAGDGICPDKGGLATQLLGQLTPPPITKTDEQFAADGLEFVYSHEGINLNELNDLFGQVGFPRRDPAKLQLALEHTHQVLWVRATKQTRWARKGQLLGFARATSDHALFGTIWDVAVTPSWQRSGIGRGAVERLTSMLLAQDVATISLYAEPGVVSLYERLGFEKDLAKIRGMSFQRKGDIGRAIMSRM